MKKTFIPAILALIFSGSVLATPANQTDSLCKQSIGHWRGTFTLKNEKECQQYGGCTHYVQADVTEINGNQYLLNLQPSAGKGGQIPVNCDGGKITSDYIPGGTAYMNCNSNNQCAVDYDDARLISHMHKQRN